MRAGPSTGWLLALFAGCLFAPLSLVAEQKCDICGGGLVTTVYLLTDDVVEQKKQVCYNCAMFKPRCSICGLPVHGDFVELPDSRALCARDAATAVLEEQEGRRIGEEMKAELDRLLSRFLALPETNVTIGMVDRVNLQQMFKFPGRDYECPNVWGYIETKTNQNHLRHEISVLSGLPLDSFKSTIAHEYAHAWVNENVGEQRRESMERDAVEGFCELVSFILMEAQHEERQKKSIQQNTYTRGQIHLFIDAYNRYGFDDVLDWMKRGRDERLAKDNPGRVRDLVTPIVASPEGTNTILTKPGETNVALTNAGEKRALLAGAEPVAEAALMTQRVTTPPPEPDTLVLKGILFAKHRPVALINDQAFAVKEEWAVRLSGTNVIVRCLEIRSDSVRIKVLNSNEERELRLKTR